MKKTKVPNIVSLAVLTVITAVFWVLFSVYRIFATRPELSVPPEILEPINPSLDKGALDKIQRATFINEGQIGETVTIPASPTETPVPSPIPTETATSSATQAP